MRARCETCDTTRPVEDKDLLDVAVKCPSCGDLLVIEESDDDPAPARQTDTAAYRMAAAALATDELGDARPTPPSGPETATFTRPLEEGDGADTAAFRAAAKALAGTARITTRLLKGQEPTLPPLPAFDGSDTQAVRALAAAAPTEPLPPPVAVGDDLDLPERAAKGPSLLDLTAAPVVVMPRGGSTGRGSRVFDRDKAPERADRAERPGKPGTRSAPRPPSDRVPAAPAAGGKPRLFDDSDLDWAKLVDGALPELEVADPDAKRIVVRLPPTAAFQGMSDIQRVEDLASMGDLPELARDLVRKDPRAAGSRQAADQETQTFQLGALRAGLDEEEKAKPSKSSSRHVARTLVDEDEPRSARSDAPTASAGLSREASRSAARPGLRLGSDVEELPPLDPTPGRVVSELRADRMEETLVVARQPESGRAASYDRLAGRLLDALVDAGAATPAPGRRPGGAVVLVTSARAGEGRTAAAANLAMAVARRPGRPAVLVDADPRGRGLSTVLGLGPSAGGLHEALRAQTDPAPWLLHLPLGKLDLLPLGTPGQDSAGLLASDALRAALEHLRPRAPRGLVIVDGPAALGPGGLFGIEAHVDAAILVVRAGETSRRDAREAASALGRKLLGVVLVEA